MALITTPVTGPVVAANGSGISSGYLKFTLSGYDTDNGQVVVPSTVQVTLGTNGTFSTNLWPNTRGVRGTSYIVTLGITTAGGVPVEVNLGSIEVPESVSAVTLDTLMGLPEFPGFNHTVVLTQAQYDALPYKDPTTIYMVTG